MLVFELMEINLFQLIESIIYIYIILIEKLESDRPKFSEIQIAKFMYQILLGIMQIHSKNIFHRDIKPYTIHIYIYI